MAFNYNIAEWEALKMLQTQTQTQSFSKDLTFIETDSYLDRLLVDEVAQSDELKSILTMLLFDDTLSSKLRSEVAQQLKMLQGSN